MRFIANLKYEQWKGRINLEWDQPAGGDAAFESAMNRIETVVGPSSRSLPDFVEKSKIVFQKAGFTLAPT